MRCWIVGTVLSALVMQPACAGSGDAAEADAAAEAAMETGRSLFQGAFDPSRNFSGDLRPNSSDELVLTAVASNRDDYAPAYSLAIAYRCLPSGKGGEWQCRFVARMLRVGPPGDDQFDRSFALLEHVTGARSTREMNTRLDGAGLEWLEADVESCKGGIYAMDSVRVADWQPDIHPALQPASETERIILHPAMIRVRMSGFVTTSHYEGWVLAAGVPEAVDKLVSTLEPCWKPSTSSPPWRRD
jgi:hypothetical protein